MSNIISPFETYFIPGRQSVDNAVICQEVIHSLRYTKARKGGMVLKLDQERAYDKMEGGFIEETLSDAKLPDALVAVIMRIIRRSSFRPPWNGERTNVIKPSRGLRQGNPWSSYLFVLCMERFSQWIARSVEEGSWGPLWVSRNGISTSHLLFADGILLFAEASEEQVSCIRDDLQKFCKALGQSINLNEFMVYFSPNVSEEVAASLSDKLGFQRTKELGHYLRHQIIIGEGVKKHMRSYYRRYEID